MRFIDSLALPWLIVTLLAASIIFKDIGPTMHLTAVATVCDKK